MNRCRVIWITGVVVMTVGMGTAAWGASIEMAPRSAPAAQEIFASQDECETTTGESCTYQLCDDIPDGLTPEEACRETPTGWIPLPSPEDEAAAEDNPYILEIEDGL